MYQDETTTTASASASTSSIATKAVKVRYVVEGLQAVAPEAPFDVMESEVTINIPQGIEAGVPALVEAGKAFLANPAVLNFLKGFEGLEFESVARGGGKELQREKVSVGKQLLQGYRMLQAKLGI